MTEQGRGSAPTWPLLLSQLLAGENLRADQAAWAMNQVMSGATPDAALAGLLVALRAKGETVTELRALADVMVQHARRFEVSGPALDIVGTGGDRSHTVNISTMACLVAAGADVPIVKHGNRAASSSSGSADVLQALGVRLDLTPEQAVAVLAQAGITFCFAQSFHPSFRHAASVRRDLAIPTAFNVLGPLTNPGQPRYAAVGVADARMAPLIAGVFADRGRHAVVFRGEDGLDEVSPAGPTRLWWVAPGQVREFTLDPLDLGLELHPLSALRGGDAEHNAGVARDFLAGSAGAVRDAVLLNAGLALAVVATGEAGENDGVPPTEKDLLEAVAHGYQRAAQAVDSGAALARLHGWVRATDALGES